MASVPEYYGILTMHRYGGTFEVEMLDSSLQVDDLVSVELETPYAHGAFLGAVSAAEHDGLTGITTYHFKFDGMTWLPNGE